MSKAITIRAGQLLAPQLDYILMDGSSSMKSNWWATLGALDNFMEVLRSQNIASHGIVHVFDSYNLESIQRDSEISKWKTFGEDPLGSTWGGTPLYDAINLMCRNLRDLDPPKASIVIATDGDEFDSEHTSAAEARALLDWCRARGWQVTFIGCDFDNSKQAKLLGANESNSVGVRRELLPDAGKELGRKRVRHAISDTEITFSEDERKNFGGYLSGPSKSA